MRRYIFRRLLNLVPVLIGITLAAFVLMYILPGDPIELLAPQSADAQAVAKIRAQYNLDAPPAVQYLSFLARAAKGDLGKSIRSGTSVAGILVERFLPTLQLALGALFFAVFFGVAAGIISAARPRSLIDAGCMLFALAGVSLPVFWLGMMLILVSAKLGLWFALSGYEPLSLRHLALPCMALGSITAASLARLTRASMLETLGKDYIRTARAKGLSEWRVLLKHALRNCLVPIVTIIGNSLAGLLSGAVLTETVFNIPGIGREIMDAIVGRDYPVVLGAVVWLAAIFVVVNLLVDILYASLDPRIRYSHD